MARNSNAPSYKKGGKVKKTGLALVHKGEVVVPKSVIDKLETADDDEEGKILHSFFRKHK